ncbi:MAG TPA: histidinol dehydrogenase [Chitinophagales bacterium]|nr:histidinol dehydrogenase [Chitinophagales bacterium]
MCARPALDSGNLEQYVRSILDAVKSHGDTALKEFSRKFDGFGSGKFAVSKSEIAAAEKKVSSELKTAVQLAKNNIGRFHASQKEREKKIVTATGVVCWRKSVPVEKVGLYIPGGSAPLFSTLLMLGIPAKLAGCREIIVCTPPDKKGNIAPEILYTAKVIGIEKIFKAGGAQAIAAMAFGTRTIPAVNKIFGPGNQFVTMAKMLVQQQGVAIDMPAGPSEVLVIADKTANPAFVAADLLSQAEHGADSQVMLVSDETQVVKNILREIEKQVKKLSRRKTAEKALQNSRAIVLRSREEAVLFSNEYAPEHLILATEDADALAEKVTNAGSVFLGNYSCESAGDYASGTNHTLPTHGFARSYSGVSLDSFVKKITFQEVSEEGILNIGPAIEQMASAEKLDAHKKAVSMRLDAIRQSPVKQSASQAIHALLRTNIVHAKPYSSARDDFSGSNKIFLDANENPFNTGYNRYPDPRQTALKEKISGLKNIPAKNIFLGNGSDEAIDLAIRAFCNPGEDKIIICPPTYGMYEVAAHINDVEVLKVPLTKNFQLDLKNIMAFSAHPGVKMIFICSPNNPTGNRINQEDIRTLLEKFHGIVVLDEAYTDFSPEGSMLLQLSPFINLIILQTFSKAWGLAGIRLGMAFAHESIISVFDKIKPPYNISELTQRLALEKLNDASKKNEAVTAINQQKNWLAEQLQNADGILKVYPSAANFLLVRFNNPEKVYRYLLDNGIVVRDRTAAVPGCLRITVGTPEENKTLIQLLKDFHRNEKNSLH